MGLVTLKGGMMGLATLTGGLMGMGIGGFPLNARVIIYNSLILSYLNYCILASGYRCERITKLQKCIVRILSLKAKVTKRD